MAATFTIEQLGWQAQLSLATPEDRESSAVSRLIVAARAGDLDAFDKLMQLEERRVYRTALHLLGRP